MKKLLILSLVSLLGITAASLFPQATAAQKGKFRRSANGVLNRYIVVLNDDVVDRFAVAPAIESEAAHLTAQHGGHVKNVYANALKGFAIEMPEKAAIALSRSERVAFVEQDAEVSVSSSQPAGSWGLDRIDQRSVALNSQYSWGPDGSTVHAYIIDTGIRPTHVEFGGRASADYDAVADGRNGIDCNGHGTHVAGTVGGATYGVAKNVRLHGVRVLECSGSGTVSQLIMGVDWVTANHISPAVANMSITASGTSNALDNAIRSSINAGVTYAVAAGNANMDACNYSPGRGASVIAVGATYTADQKVGYSNWGSCVDIWAPGSGITSASHASDVGTRLMSGTSMASPHVAGVAALYLSANPNASPATVRQNIYDTSTSGIVTGLDAASPNRLLYSWFGTPPTPAAGRVTIKKRATFRTPETTGTAAFPFDAVNLEAASFTLQPENEYVDSNVTEFGTGSTIRVTEAPVFGWALTSISCVETSGGPGFANLANSTVDLGNRRADIVVEEGENVECTFTSEPLAPSAAHAVASGRVTSRDGGRGVRNVRLTLVNATSGEVRYASTNTFGYYSFRELETGQFYVLTAASTKTQRIADNVRSFSLSNDLYDINFRTVN